MNEVMEAAVDRIAEMAGAVQSRFQAKGLTIPAATAVEVVLQLPTESMSREPVEAAHPGQGPPG